MLELTLLPRRLSVCRLDRGAPLPSWAFSGPFFSVTRTAGELSIVCDQTSVPPGVPAEDGLRAFEVAGPLDFSLTGILSSLLEPLALAGIPVFAISTHDTDYVLVRERDLPKAAAALRQKGYGVSGDR